MFRCLRIIPCAALAAVVLSSNALAQVTDNLASRSPRFLVASATSSRPVAAKPADAPMLFNRISVDFTNTTLGEALAEISEKSGLTLNYSDRVVPVRRMVRLRADDITVAAALTEILLDTKVDVLFTGPNQAVLVARPEPPPRPTLPGGLLGRVVSKSTEDTVSRSVVGALVVVEGTNLRTITNEYGIFRFPELPVDTQTITVTSIGHKRSSTKVLIEEGKMANVMISLEISPTSLTELVVTATGRQRRVELGNDITVLKVDSIVATQPITSVTDLLEGRVPGLVVQRTSGAPGDPARIRLRGNSSALLSNDPIVIVDGIRVYSQQSDERGGNLAASKLPLGMGASAVGGYNYLAPSPLDNIDPHSIERIEVVKGPSAATLYGQDAANGVIVVTTKRGQPGPARWNFITEYGTTRIPGQYPDMLVRFGHPFTSGERVICPVIRPGEPLSCVPTTTERFQMLNDPELTVLDRGHSEGLSMGVSGGSEALTYSLNGSFRNEVGILALPQYEIERYREQRGEAPPDWMLRPQNHRRWGVTSRMTARLSESANVSIQASLTRSTQQRSSLERQLGTLMTTYLDRETGTYYVPKSGSLGAPFNGEEFLQDYAERANARSTQFTNGVNVTWRPSNWLTTTADAGINVVSRSDDILLPRGFGDGALVEGKMNQGEGTSLKSTVNLGARAQFPLAAGFRLQVASGVNYSGESIHDLVTVATGLAEGTESINGAATIQANENSVTQATFGWYIEPGINHRRFWLSTGLRLDGGSTFGTRLKLPAFPKLSASYLISDEPFFPKALSSVFNTLRLRAAYGQAGRVPGPVDRLRLYGSTIMETIDGQTVPTVVLTALGNTKLRPERSKEFEGGFDADMFDDRISLSLTAYRKTTTDQILSVPVAPSVYGNIKILQNIGTVRNEGVELSLGLQPVRGSFATWSMQLGFSQNRNLVLELGDGVEPFFTETTLGGSSGVRVAAGFPLFGRWSKPVLGYADGNGNGRLDQTEVLLGDTMVYVGGTQPDYTASLHSTLSLLNGALSVSVGVLYENGMVQRNELGRRLAPFSRGANDPTAPLHEQAMFFDDVDYMWTQAVNTLRFNSLSVRYQVPTHWAQRFGARALSVAVQGTNLGLRTNYRGFDPNVNARVSGNGVSDNGVLPEPRVWQIRVNANY